MQNKDVKSITEVKARLMSLINEYWDNPDGTLPEIKECLRTLHDDILDSYIVDGYLVEKRPSSFLERIDDITWLNATSYVYRNNNETILYFFRKPDGLLVCTLSEDYLSDVDLYRKNQTQQRLAVLNDELEYCNEQLEWMVDEIEDLTNEIREKKENLSKTQRGKLCVQNAILKCKDFWK